MRNPLVLSACPLIALPAWAEKGGDQPETLFSGEMENGGFGAPVVKITTIDGNAEVMVGGRGGWIINHTFVLGGGGYGTATKTRSDRLNSDGQYEFGHGGLELEYIWRHAELVHGTFLLHVGAGSIEHPGFLDTRAGQDSVFVLEPTVSAELNVVKFFRVAIGGGYRFVIDVDVNGLNDGDLSGPAGTITLKFGWF